MNKLSSAMMAGAAALALASTLSFAADQTKPTNETPPRASENQPGDPGAVKSAPEQANQEKEYMAALKKCDTLKGGDKQACIDAAERKFGRM